MKSLADFEAIRIINLAHRADRRAEIAEQLERVGLGFASSNVSLFDAYRPHDAGGFDSIGARGCFMSHLGVLREAKSCRNLLVLEDDLDFVPHTNIAARIRTALEALPEDWGIFYGGCVTDVPPGAVPVIQISPAASVRTSHFIAFNGHVIGRVVEYLEAILHRPPGHPDGGPMHVDGAYSRFRADNPAVRVFAAIPELGYQRASRTDIHSLRWFDRAPIVRELVRKIRRHRAEKKRVDLENS